MSRLLLTGSLTETLTSPNPHPSLSQSVKCCDSAVYFSGSLGCCLSHGCRKIHLFSEVSVSVKWTFDPGHPRDARKHLRWDHYIQQTSSIVRVQEFACKPVMGIDRAPLANVTRTLINTWNVPRSLKSNMSSCRASDWFYEDAFH